MYYFALLCVFSTAAATKTTASTITVPGDGHILVDTEPWVKLYQNGDSYYYFETAFKGNYFQATQFCNYHNMKLLSIESLEENKFLYEKLGDIVGNDSYSFWTSGTSLGSHPKWVWLSSGEILNFQNWLAGEPNNKENSERCIEIIYEPKKYSNIIWNDENCNGARFTICETTPLKSVSSISVRAFQ